MGPATQSFLKRLIPLLTLSLIVGYIVREFIIPEIETDIDSLQTIGGIIATIYTLITAFIIVEVWSEFNGISNHIATEASLLISLWNYTDYLDNTELDKEMRTALKNYVDRVLEFEKEEAAKGKRVVHPSDELIKILRIIDKIQFKTEKDITVLPSLIKAYDDISSARSNRLDDSVNRIPKFLHFLFIFLSTTTVLSIAFLTFSSLIVQLISLGVISGIIITAYILVIDLDNPFDGLWNIDYSPFEEAKEYIETSENI